jgi:hypothetical protein
MTAELLAIKLGKLDKEGWGLMQLMQLMLQGVVQSCCINYRKPNGTF